MNRYNCGESRCHTWGPWTWALRNDTIGLVLWPFIERQGYADMMPPISISLGSDETWEHRLLSHRLMPKMCSLAPYLCEYTLPLPLIVRIAHKVVVHLAQQPLNNHSIEFSCVSKSASNFILAGIQELSSFVSGSRLMCTSMYAKTPLI